MALQVPPFKHGFGLHGTIMEVMSVAVVVVTVVDEVVTSDGA
jgi:hypothetical protein